MGKANTIICTFLLIFPIAAYAQSDSWQVTSENASVKNPTKINPKNIAVGKNLFVHACVACHGDKADGKGLIQSASLISEAFQKQNDGAIFYKIHTGRNKMPSFKGNLKDDEIWSVINYLRVLVNPSATPPAKDVAISITAIDDQKAITAFVTSTDSIKLPLADIDVHFYIKRDFGLLPIGGGTNYTEANGKVTVMVPEKIIGDTLGNLEIIAKIENNFLYSDAQVSTQQKWGEVLKTEDEKFNQRVLWGSRSKSPIWLLLLANGIIVVVWGVIIYILFNLVRIKKAGKIFLK